MRRSKLHEHVTNSLIQLDYLEGAVNRSNNLDRCNRLVRELRRDIMRIQQEVLNYEED
jgi:hypothetical protein